MVELNVELNQKSLTTSELEALVYFDITEEVCISVSIVMQEESKHRSVSFSTKKKYNVKLFGFFSYQP